MKPPRIKNETQFDGRTVGGIIRWVFRQLDLDGVGVMVKVRHCPQGAYAGRFYPNPRDTWAWVYDSRTDEYREVRPSVPSGVRHLLICRIAKDGYPRTNHVYPRKDSPGTWEVADWRESLVSIAAHEAMHLRQHRTGKRYSEVETEWAAFRLWREWREWKKRSS